MIGRLLRHVRGTGDAGMTLMELVVSMTVMGVFLTVSTAGIVQMYRAANKTESMSVAQAQIKVMFLRLDKEIRYASAISTPARVGADWYVEWQTTHTGTAECTQLRLTVGPAQLQHRSWRVGVTPGGWSPLASGVRAPTGGQPFSFDATSGFHRLKLSLVAEWGSGDSATSAESVVTFTALNTSLGTSSSVACTEGRSVP